MERAEGDVRCAVDDDGVATVTLHRPERLNAITPAMHAVLRETLEGCDREPGVRAIVLTGAGRGFCAGADLSVLAGASDLAGRAAEVPAPIVLGTPMVTAVNGPVAGMGLPIALLGDVVYAAAGARISSTFARLGLVAEWGSAWQLTRRCGAGAAADLLLTGRTVTAEEALGLRLVDRVLAPEELLPAAVAWAREVATCCSPTSTAIIKAQLREAWGSSYQDEHARSVGLMLASFTGPDLAEALTARAEGRAPRFGPNVAAHPTTTTEETRTP